LIEKIRSLRTEEVHAIESFADFLCQRQADRDLTRAAAKLSEAAFERVWANPDDAEYDRL
jgi:hypothetical protein